MAKRNSAPPAADADCISDDLHPRRTMRLTGQDAALGVAARAIRCARPPQAWLLCGSPGIGKATLAYRIARYLLEYGATANGAADLSVPETSSAAMQIISGAHPGLMVLKRGANPNTGKLMTVLAVEEVRKLNAFFGMSSGAGGWRVVIVDTADDMNDASANALLKLLEEPPPRAMLLLLANAPGRMLPTIRSRCQRLSLRPLSDADMAAELKPLLPELNAEERASLIRLAAGSLGAALRLAGGDGMMLAAEAGRLIDSASVPDIPALFELSDKLARIADGPEMLSDFLLQALSDRIRARAVEPSAHLGAWTDALEKMNSNAVRGSALHLDPRQVLLGAAHEMQTAARRAGTV
jgi:DNA polymerase III subunit delta'